VYSLSCPGNDTALTEKPDSSILPPDLSTPVDPQPYYRWCFGKVLSREEAHGFADRLKREGKALVTVNGSFDLLHPGHLVILSEAKAQGDVLFVGVNSDASVRTYKGNGRPIIPEKERIAMLAALSFVDYIILFDEPEVGRQLLLTVRPHVHVNGSEYGDPETWVEWPVMQEVGARGYRVARRSGLATTDIIAKIRSLPEVEDPLLYSLL